MHVSPKGEKMVFCRGCGKEIHQTAPTCPQCGCPQNASVAVASHHATGSLIAPIASLVLGIISVLALFDDSEWDKETILGLGLFSIVGFVLGAIGLGKGNAGKGMSVTGVVLSSIAFVVFLGMYN